MLRINTFKTNGIEAIPVTLEVEIHSGLGIHVIGLEDAAVKESLLRTITAMQTFGYHMPGKKIVINLAPADLQKNGSGYDLPIALGIITASGQVEMPDLSKYLIKGELGLDGSVREVPGALTCAELASEKKYKGIILPATSAIELSEIKDMEVYGIETLQDAIDILQGKASRKEMLVRNTKLFQRLTTRQKETDAAKTKDFMDFSEIIGNERAKRGLEIAAAGGHNVMMLGNPGSGKSLLARATLGILPPMTTEEAVVTSKIYSVAGLGGLEPGLVRTRPFRSPHYSASFQSIVGGGCQCSPGEVSLAHNGILYLDDYSLIPASKLECVRAPMEDRKVTISRLKSKVEYPASFMLIAASNPCPCGYYGDGDRCTCTDGQRQAYLKHLSGPIMDRIDIQLWLHPVNTKKPVNREKGEPSAIIAKRVEMARNIQKRRFAGEGIFTNAEMNEKMLKRFCPLDEGCKSLMEHLINNLGLSARAYSRIIKVARTIADLEKSKNILKHHLAEAASYSLLDKIDK